MLYAVAVIATLVLGARLIALANELPERWGRAARRQGRDGKLHHEQRTRQEAREA